MNSERIDRILSVLRHLAQHPGGLPLKQLSDDLALPMSSTHDLVQAMVEIDAVRIAGPRHYALGTKAVNLSLTIVDSLSLRGVARSHLTEVSAAISENVYLAARTGDTVSYLDRSEAVQVLSVVMALGADRPLHASSVGKLITAFNPDLEEKVLAAPSLDAVTPFSKTNRADLREEYQRIREQGFSVSDGESVAGIVGISTPIRDHTAAVVGALHVSAPLGRLAADRRPYVIEQLAQASAEISRRLGHVAAGPAASS